MSIDRKYEERIEQELTSYATVTEVHGLPPIYHYWSNKFLNPKLKIMGFESLEHLFYSYVARDCASKAISSTSRVISIGAGNCDFELKLARRLRDHGMTNFRFECLELNQAMLDRGYLEAERDRLLGHFVFTACDLNEWQPSEKFDLALANHSLHHIVELERVFSRVRNALTEGGVFVVNDMIGRNGHMRWPEAMAVIPSLWKYLPETHKFNHQLKRVEPEYVNWDCSQKSFEGIRAQDILPELLKCFDFDLFLGFCNLVDIFIDRGFGPNFDVENEWDKLFIDRVHELDEELLERGQIKPTHMLAVLAREGAQRKHYKHMTPAFCVRWP